MFVLVKALYCPGCIVCRIT